MTMQGLSRLFNAPRRQRQRSVPAGTIELGAIPPVLRAADSGFVGEWAAGLFPLAGHSIALDGRSPFEVDPVPLNWRRELFAFTWLRHVPPTADAETLGRVQSLFMEWQSDRRQHKRIRHSPLAEDVGVTARRLLALLAHADLLLCTTDAAFYDTVLTAIAADVAWIERNLRTISGSGDRLLALVALAQAGLCIEDGDGLLRATEVSMQKEYQVRAGALRPDAQMTSLLRDPDMVAERLLDVETLRRLYGMRSRPVPEVVLAIKALLVETLAGLMLGNRRPMRLGMPRENTEAELVLASIVRHVGLPDAGSRHDQNAGYVRIVDGETCMVTDVGAPFDWAGALEIELSSGCAALFVHDGCEAGGEDNRRRAVMLDLAIGAASATTSARFVANAPTLEPTHSITADLAGADKPASGMQTLDATHAGQSPTGFVHRRRLQVAEHGRRVDGIDELRPLIGATEAVDRRYTVRFVLHPRVDVTLLDVHRVDLRLPNGHRWQFEVLGRPVSIEAAAYRDGLRTFPTMQIVVPGDTALDRSVKWQLTRVDGDL